LVLDIETVPDLTLWTSPETPLGQERPFPPTYAHRVIVVGFMWLDRNYRLRELGLIGPRSPTAGDERSILDEFSRFVDQHRPSLVTYNGRTFDLPVLALRSLHCGVPMGWYYQGGLRYRYSERGHIDLCDWLADHGAARSSSLDALARLIGLPGKIGVDGSQIEGLHRAGHSEQIENYCLADVAQTALLFLRFRLLQGVLSRDEYRAVVTELTSALCADARLSGLTRAIDGERLLSAA
jgi:predicted PolB exonuclease-like 3'-5' exonuclease